MTSVKARLSVVLKADDVVVAEVDDALLWQRVLTAINSGDSTGIGQSLASAPNTPNESPAHPIAPSASAFGSDPIDKLSREIGLDRAIVEGALTPSTEAPFLHLNSHNWEAMRKQLPSRGSVALSPIAASATVLGLWFRAAGLGNATQAQALAVLRTIGQDDKNPSRGVRASTWLIARPGGQIQLNAGEISAAIRLGKAFCSKTWADWLKGAPE